MGYILRFDAVPDTQYIIGCRINKNVDECLHQIGCPERCSKIENLLFLCAHSKVTRSKLNFQQVSN